MPISVVMPALEMAQETGKLISWRKKEGESVSKGEPLFEIETDKAVMEIESPADGVLAGVKAHAGAEIQVGRTIAWIVKAGEVPPPEDAPGASRAEPARKFEGTFARPVPLSISTAPSATREIKISPKARRLATEKGIDLANLHGSGPAGEILATDILNAAKSISSAPPATKAPNPVPPQHPSPIARLMAERTTQGWTTVPHFFVTRQMDATALNTARQNSGPAIEKSHGIKLTHSDLLIALVARVLLKHPKLISSWIGDNIRANRDVNINLAMAVSDGVVAPVILNADAATLATIATQRGDLTERARSHKLRPSDLAGGTFTVSNLGMFDIDAFTAIITPPQVAILAVGRIAKHVVALEGQPAVRSMMTLTLSCDHRVVDGARAAEFMRDVADAIANPQKWLG
jgi:pyruvate dehydrogenase E2 component (dihydrolipoamide acetyltransferase)